MIKARIRWCTCRVENILTLGKLLSLWFCFLLHSILFLVSQTSYRTYKIISSYELARPIMGTIFLFLVLVHGISCSLEHLINLSSCTGASKVPSGTVVGIRLFEHSHSKLAVEMIGLVWLQSMPSDSYLHLFVGGRFDLLLRSTIFVGFRSLHGILIVHCMVF